MNEQQQQQHVDYPMYNYNEHPGLVDVMMGMGSEVYTTAANHVRPPTPRRRLVGVTIASEPGEADFWLVILQGLTAMGEPFMEEYVELEVFWLQYRLEP